MDLQRIEKKLREARYFLWRMIDQENGAIGDREPFGFYLRCPSERSKDSRPRHEQELAKALD
jgi:hypothetical protein